ncbi:bifunctional precorrin-2 dehydrogenase/sirohydrochlorin ferrochelatase [Bacillus paralicheniformis]|jgi:precorrin-2 dehydrogenase/sirohydrochlorin ferrochelatase|uniref:precorrin-2 dehydrogenase/sirohydrochlorin ferrochelatase family protein n=1 Tax=Bacillus TaxID=1386 RepID=UPI0003423DF0|nr:MULTISPECIES: bifunctional precorrin-2 dehydrogenase/sirohydrochlorin ferrochelatase [Bacillus]KJD54314.1 precorrin-2 dehydrogenase [Bacillus amyloliquefaciens]KUL07437.1 precorrin-2 dehydrogenase [Bacillus licheniformis LMG 7559]AGN36185.1 precorrin-2 dehydrogenase SirC [Bacillus paralicheniformis ATCC 9945a]AYQ16224.1 bifunctional precorrin-2 dehydrogenase/sirohydrochlorin ferrochelatase [Bacillus paralicheniformis]KND08088.1 precorrin-2 dehydrogenase [Bacillus paralicheniformis]
MLPLHINIKGKSAVIAGGGEIAARRLKTVLAEGASATVISPEVSEEMLGLIEEHGIEWKKKKAEPGDFKDAFLIILATDDHEVNKRIAASAAPDQLVNVASEAELGNVYVPKIINRGNITISVSTNGASPRHTIKLAGQIDDLIDDELVQEIDELLRKRRGLNQ